MGHFLRKFKKKPVHQESIVITKSWSHDMLGDGSSGIMEGAAYAEPHRKQSTQFETPHRKQSKAGLKHRVGFFSIFIHFCCLILFDNLWICIRKPFKHIERCSRNPVIRILISTDINFYCQWTAMRGGFKYLHKKLWNAAKKDPRTATWFKTPIQVF